jgi:hypothetical protein
VRALDVFERLKAYPWIERTRSITEMATKA